MSDKELCGEHTGCLKDINNLEKSDSRQWKEINENRNRLDMVMSRLNTILGGVVVSLIVLVLNLIVGVFKISVFKVG